MVSMKRGFEASADAQLSAEMVSNLMDGLPIPTIDTPDEYMAVTDDFLASFVDELVNAPYFPESEHTTASKSNGSDGHSGTSKRKKQNTGSPDVQISDSSVIQNVVAGETHSKTGAELKQTPAQLKAQRRYRERQRQRITNLEDQVSQLQARVHDLESTIVELKSRPAPDVQDEQIQDNVEQQLQLQCQQQQEEVEENSALDLSQLTQPELEKIHWAELDILRGMVNNGLPDSALLAQLQVLSRTCQAAMRAVAGKDAGRMVLNDRGACEAVSQESVDFYRFILKEVDLRPHQLQACLDWRREYLDTLEPIFNKRQMLVGNLVQALPMRNMSSTDTMKKDVAGSAEVLEQIKENLREQQRLIVEYGCNFFQKVMQSPRDTARLICLASGKDPATSRHLDPLALVNVIVKDKLAQ